MATRFRKLRTRKMKSRKALKTRTHRGGDVASFLSKGKSMLNKLKPQTTKNAETFIKYLDQVKDEIMYKLTHNQRIAMKNALLDQLKEDITLLTERRKNFGEKRFSEILEKIEKIKKFIETDTENNND